MKVLIVGGGLSGICIAHQLLKRKIDFKILDKNDNNSTIVAAGMINPMTFRRMIKAWNSDKFVPVLQEVYREIEEVIDTKFFHPIKIRRVFSTEHERKLWEDRLNEEDYADYVNPFESAEEIPDYFHNLYGTGIVSTPGYVDAKTFMNSNHKFFLDNGLLVYSSFDFDDFDAENMSYQGEKYSHVIFAEGSRGENNPFFNYLPFKNVKGEVLTIKSEVLRKDEILNRKCFILPTKDGLYRLGSTYKWGITDPSPTEEGKEELLEAYSNLSDSPIEIIGHEAGIRPVAADRRLLIGEHPKHKGIYIFNGLGTKGYMNAPYFSIEFVQHLIEGKELDKEVDIQRYYKHFNEA